MFNARAAAPSLLLTPTRPLSLSLFLSLADATKEAKKLAKSQSLFAHHRCSNCSLQRVAQTQLNLLVWFRTVRYVTVETVKKHRKSKQKSQNNKQEILY